MGIKYNEKTGEFHLYNKEISYIMRIMQNGHLENLHYGKRIHEYEGFSHLHEEYLRSGTSLCVEDPGVLSLTDQRQEYPSYGLGDFRVTALSIRQKNGSRVVDFKYKSHEIYEGKKKLTPLPATYVNEDKEAQSLDITLYDDVTGMELILSYTIFNEYPVITRNVLFKNKGSESVFVDKAMSACIDFLDMNYEMIHLSGSWARERYVKVRKIESGISSVYGLTGTCGSSEHNPFIALKRYNTSENIGEVYGFSLVYSGNFLAQVEVSAFDMTRVIMGIHPEGFSYYLNKGEEFQTPEVVMVYSNEGLNKMSRTYHDLYKNNLIRGKWKNKVRPILLNNWEATYFDFNEEKIIELAKKAKEAGVELFVLDDGWFGKRNDDFAGLGDWYVNTDKLPSGISGLSKKINDLGLKFGLWIEPEMVNKDSDLYRKHPDWIISIPDRFESPGRHQYVLDFSRKEVVDYIHEMISEIIRESNIDYIKWDMNRYMTQPYSKAASPDEQGMVMHKYILGVYDLYNRLTEEFDHILFESCASGGSRFDPAMLYFAPQTWTSDDTDAYERVKIQYGTSMVYPIVSMGSHVSAVPNHQVRRYTTIDTRANIAYFGTFGYELDLGSLSDDEFESVKDQILFMKKYRELIQVDGDFYRISSPFEKNDSSWIVVSKDKERALALYVQRLNKVNASWIRLKLCGLDKETLYEVSYKDIDYSQCQKHKYYMKKYKAYGDELMNAGIPIDRQLLTHIGGDFASIIFEIEKAE